MKAKQKVPIKGQIVEHLDVVNQMMTGECIPGWGIVVDVRREDGRVVVDLALFDGGYIRTSLSDIRIVENPPRPNFVLLGKNGAHWIPPDKNADEQGHATGIRGRKKPCRRR